MSRVAILKTVPFKREQENIIGFTSRSAQRQYFADLAGKSTFDELFIGIGERNFLPSTDTLATLRIDLKSYPIPFNTIEALNCQYAIVNYEYALGSSNWGSGYLFYFITQAKSINMNTVEYSLELDVFNTYLRGEDWDLPLTLYVERAHLLRYNYVNNELQPFFRDYWYNSEGVQPPTYLKNSSRLFAPKNLWLYIIVKTSLPGYSIEGITEQGSIKANAFGYTNYKDLLNNYVAKSPYAIVWFPLSGTIKFDNGGDLTGSYGSTLIYAYAQEYLSPNIVGVFVSEIEPKEFTDDAVYTESRGVYTITLGSDCKAFYKELNGKNYVLGVSCFNYNFKRLSYEYTLQNTIYNNPKKYSEYEGDIKEDLYREFIISCDGTNREYNILKLQSKTLDIYDMPMITDSGVVHSYSIYNGLYEGSVFSGDVYQVNRKMECPSLSDSYQNWIANNKQYGVTGYLVPAFKSVVTGASAGAVMGGAYGAAAGALGGAITGIFNYINASANEKNEITKPDTLNGGSFDLLSSVSRYGTVETRLIETDIEPTSKKELDTLFLKYGYAVNMELSLGMLYTRYKYNYVKTGENISDRIRILNGNVSNNILNIISDKFLYGVREWNSSYIDDKNNPFNYGHGGVNIVENWEQLVFDSLPE